LKAHQQNQKINSNRLKLKNSAGLALLSLLALASPLMASDFSVSGESSTILRMGTTTDNQNLYPLYEYLRLGMSDKLADGSTVSFNLGAWGRVDLGDRTTNKYSDHDLQYAFISYRAAKNNTVLNLGRQFITEGVASEKIDGLYLRQDFIEGLSASAFVGKPVLTETDFTGANLIYGARISHSMPKLYTIGFSALKNEESDGSKYREEQGIDIWVHPVQQLDLTGRSSYNSISNDWMEHAYTLTLSPIEKLKLSANVTNINYRDYLMNVTTKALSLTNGIINPYESLLSTGIAASYALTKDATVTADYKNYNYDVAGDADYFGGKLALNLPDILSGGIGIHRMEGDNDRLRYTEYRLYALKKLGQINLNADIFNVSYDKSINGVKNSFAITGSAGYEINEQMRLGADIEYSRTPDYYREYRGLMKFIYAFDTKHTEGRGKSEK